MTKKTWDEHLSSAFKNIFLLIFGVTILYFIYYCVTSDYKGAFNRKVTYLNEWICKVEDGEAQSITLPIDVEAENGQCIEFITTLPDDVTDGMWMAFSNSKDVTVWVGDQVRYTWDRADADVPGEPAKPVYMFVPLYTSDAGAEVTIYKRGTKYNGGMVPVIVGDKMSVMDELKRTNGYIQFQFAVFLLILSVIMAFGGMFLKREFNQNIYLINISWGIMATSSWLVFNSSEFQLMTGIQFIDGIVSYILTLIMIFPYISYINDIQKHRYKYVYLVVSIIEMLNFVICVSLHMFGVYNFAEMLRILDIVIVWIILIVFVCTILDVIKGLAWDYLYVAIGLGVFMISCVLEVSLINLQKHRIDGTSMLLGLFFLMVMAVMQQIRDIRLIQRDKNIAAEADKARNEFLSKMSHEIRTPINAILGMNEMILRGDKGTDIKEYARNIGKSGQILLSIINDIFDYSEFRNGNRELDEMDYNVRNMIDGVVTVLHEHAAVKNIGVNVGMPGNLPEQLCGDEQAIIRVLSNVNSNAVKYTDKGSITFAMEYIGIDAWDGDDKASYADYDGVLRFYIKDTGRGIASADIPTLFDGKADSDKREDIGDNPIEGAGLGLSIAKKLVDMMQGRIEVESEVGTGTLFTISIPQKKATHGSKDALVKSKEYDGIQADGGNKIDPDTATEGSGHDYSDGVYYGEQDNECIKYSAPAAKILAVDDNSANLIVMREFLKSINACVETASGGQEAIDKCKEKTYDIILMDHMMPEVDGFEAMEQIRKSLESINRKTPIIVVTANAVGNCRDEYLAKGFDGYLSKPIDHDKLLRLVKKTINPKLITECDEKEAVAGEVTAKEDSNTLAYAPVGDNQDIINFSNLAKRFDNQQAVIDMILAECVKESDRKKKLLKDLYEAGDIQRYGVEAHGLKGVMASICADNISAHARQHEFAAKEGRVDFIRDDIDAFIDEYTDTIDYIEKYLQSRNIEVAKIRVVAAADDEQMSMQDIVEQIGIALDDFDVDKALSYIDRLEAVVDEDRKEYVAEIRGHADDFEYDKAKESLGRFIADN